MQIIYFGFNTFVYYFSSSRIKNLRRCQGSFRESIIIFVALDEHHPPAIFMYSLISKIVVFYEYYFNNSSLLNF